jgi:DeoR/GlpR family transcriptional regulator of sugar metabolism
MRLNQIKEYIADKKRVKVAELSERFNVSNISIRQDLSILENEGFLVRSHGGAVLVERAAVSADTRPADNPALAFRLEKLRSIAEVAANYINTDAWIFISTGLTGQEIAKKIMDRKLNVVTSGLNIAILLAKSENTVMIPGGIVFKRQNDHTVAGDWYLRALSELSIAQVFLSISGVSLETGFSVENPGEFLYMEKLKEISREIIVVFDSTKINERAFMSVADLTYADTVITNKELPDAYRVYFREHGIKLLTD